MAKATKATKAKAKAPAKAKAKATKAAPKGSTFARSTIKVLITNASQLPARKGSHRLKKYLVLAKMDGKTVSDYYAAIRAEVAADRINDIATITNVKVAIARGIIKVTPPKGTKAA